MKLRETIVFDLMRSAYHRFNGTAAYSAKKVKLLESELAFWKTEFQVARSLLQPIPDVDL